MSDVWFSEEKMVVAAVCSRVRPRRNKANVPADLQSAGIEYKDFNPLASYFN